MLVLPDQVFRRPTEHRRGRLIDKGDTPVDIETMHTFADRLQDECVIGVRFRHMLKRSHGCTVRRRPEGRAFSRQMSKHDAASLSKSALNNEYRALGVHGRCVVSTERKSYHVAPDEQDLYQLNGSASSSLRWNHPHVD